MSKLSVPPQKPVLYPGVTSLQTRRMRDFRRRIYELEAATPGDFDELWLNLKMQARANEPWANQLYFAYTAGKPDALLVGEDPIQRTPDVSLNQVVSEILDSIRKEEGQ